MPQRMMRKLVTATIAVGLIGGSAFGSPLAFADPEPAPDRSRRLDPLRAAEAPIDPAAAIASPPPAVRPVRAAASRGSAGCSAAARSRRPAGAACGSCRPAGAARAACRSVRGSADDHPEGTPAGQNPTPYIGDPVFLPPSFNPVNGSMVGVGKPIIINFQRPIVDRPMAEQAIHISSTPAVPGKFYWMSDTQVRWRPLDLWPKDTNVLIDAGGAKSTFRTGESLVATIDDKTHQMAIVRNGRWRRRSRCRWASRAATRPRTARTTCSRSSRHRDGLRDIRRAERLRRVTS